LSDHHDLIVAIHAQLLPGSAGGIETNLLSLLKALDRISRAERQIVIGPGGESQWLASHLGSQQTILPWTPIPFSLVRRPDWLPACLWEFSKRRLGRQRFKAARYIHQAIKRAMPHHLNNGKQINHVLIEMGAQVVHFPYQSHFQTTLPSIFEPWDLQHRHYPEFFTPQEIQLREESYKMGCKEASLVVTASEWTKRDIVRQFAIDPNKIAIIRRGPIVSDCKKMTREEALSKLQSKNLPERFILYPAKTWPHKNHIRLFQALARLRDKYGFSINLVCTGKPIEEHWQSIKKSLEELSLERSVIFTGFLDDAQMEALFVRAEFLIFPSLFEGLGIPLLEAMHFGLPIVTSHVTCLPEVAADAALYFDPLSVDSMVDAIQRAWSDPLIREECAERGAVRVKGFSWDEAARQFLACYRYIAKQQLNSEDSKRIREITACGYNGHAD
jgi:glycosyltransferase involved in cell wall biosynthesis